MKTAKLAVAAVLASVSIVACGGDDADVGYSLDDFGDGVLLEIDDDAGAVASATVFLPDELPSYATIGQRLDQERVVVLQPGEGGYDAVVLHRTGPFCGVPPDVFVTGDQLRLRVEIAIVTAGAGEGECAAMEYDEAIGFDLVSEFEDATVEAVQSEPL